MKFIILADKFQKRMKSKGCVGLMPFKNTCLFDYQYSIIRSVFPDATIVYVYGFDSKRFISFYNKNDYNNTHLICNNNYEQYNHSYSLYLAKEYIDEDCMIMFGDVLINNKTFSKFNPLNGSQIFINNTNYNSDIGCVINKNCVYNIAHGLSNKLCNIYYINKQHRYLLQKIINNNEYHNYFIFEILNKMIEQKTIVSPYFVTNKDYKQSIGKSYV
jgi:bifunctional N-acetylglucosamine-1-phosphate-uridyltransferase/glucosamine-1-phosphate-acetyltransferase GlmU-like protein